MALAVERFNAAKANYRFADAVHVLQARHRDGRCCTVCYDAPFRTGPPRFDIAGPQGCLSLLGYRHAVVCDDWEDAPRARFDSLSYSLLAPGADAMSAAHETHLTRLWDHLGSWFAIEDRV